MKKRFRHEKCPNETFLFLINKNKSCKRFRLSCIHIILAASFAVFVIIGYGIIGFRAAAYLFEREAFGAQIRKHERLVRHSDLLNELVYALSQPSHFSLPIEYSVFHPSSVPFGIPSKGLITSRFGSRTDPVFEGTAFHMGVDIAHLEGEPVWATASGNVSFAGVKQYFGNVVEVDHFESGYKTVYAHLQTINVKTGQNVIRGQELGNVGTTGKSTGPHLHYEVRFNGLAVDPIPYMIDSDVVR